MDANIPYQIIQYAANKAQKGYISPENYNLIINQAQRQYLDYLLGEYQKYQPGRPISVVELGEKEKLRQSIAPLIYGTFLAPNTNTGIALFPSDFEIVDAMWGWYGFYNIKFVNQPRLSSFYHSKIDPVVTNPVYLLKHEGFQFYPENIGNARMSYVRNPPTIIWAYDEDSNGQPVYNGINSVAPVWGDFDMMNIISRALMIVSVNLKEGELMQYAQDVKNGGQ